VAASDTGNFGAAFELFDDPVESGQPRTDQVIVVAGPEEALFLIGLAKHDRAAVDRFMAEVAEIPEVRSAFLITGRYDFIVHVVARDMQHLKDLALGRFTNRPGVTRIETSIIHEARARHELPQLQRRLPCRGESDRVLRRKPQPARGGVLPAGKDRTGLADGRASAVQACPGERSLLRCRRGDRRDILTSP